MNEISELKKKINYLEDTLACMRGENAALKAKLAQLTPNKQCTVCQSKNTVSVVAYYKCSDCKSIIEPERD